MKLQHHGFRLSVSQVQNDVWIQSSDSGDPRDGARFVRVFAPNIVATFVQTFAIIKAARNLMFVDLQGESDTDSNQSVTIRPNPDEPDSFVVIRGMILGASIDIELSGRYDTEEYATQLEALGFVRVEEEEAPTLPM